MAWTTEEIQEIDALLNDPDISPEIRALFEEKKRAQQAESAAQGGVTEDSLDPNLPLMPQVHATMPNETGPAALDPEGTLAQSGGKGVVFFYEPPVDVIRQKLATGQQDILPALGYDIQLTPEEIASIGPGDPIYDAVVDEEYRKAASEADKKGVSAYRYSKEDWLQGGSALEVLKNFGTKLQGSVTPALDTAKSFVLGVDDMATFGAVQAAENAVGEAIEPGLGKWAEEQDEAVKREHPIAYTAGQVVGAVALPWSLTNRLADYVTKGVRSVLPSSLGAAGKIAAATGAGAISGAGVAAGQLAVDQASESQQQGQLVPPTDEELRGVADEAILGAGAGGALEGVGAVGGYVGRQIMDSRLFGGAPGRLEKAGKLDVSPVGGVKVPDETKALVDRAHAERSHPIDLLSEDLGKPLAKAGEEAREEVVKEIGTFKQSFYATPAGRQRMRPENYQNKLVELMRKHSDISEARGVREPVDKAGEELIGRFNHDVVDKVSTEPIEGGIELSLDEADAFLATKWKKDLVPETAPSPTEEALRKKSGDKPKDFMTQMRDRGVEKVYVQPKRMDAMRHEEVIDDIDGWSRRPEAPGEVVAELDAALRADRAARSPEFAEGLKQRSERLTQIDTTTARSTGFGNPQRGERERQVMRSISEYGRGGKGRRPEDQAVAELADRAGKRGELEDLAATRDLIELSERTEFLGSRGYGGLDGRRINLIDPMIIRSLPAARALGNEAGGFRGGRGARFTAPDIPRSLRGFDSRDALIRESLELDEQEK